MAWPYGGLAGFPATWCKILLKWTKRRNKNVVERRKIFRRPLCNPPEMTESLLPHTESGAVRSIGPHWDHFVCLMTPMRHKTDTSVAHDADARLKQRP